MLGSPLVFYCGSINLYLFWFYCSLCCLGTSCLQDWLLVKQPISCHKVVETWFPREIQSYSPCVIRVTYVLEWWFRVPFTIIHRLIPSGVEEIVEVKNDHWKHVALIFECWNNHTVEPGVWHYTYGVHSALPQSPLHIIYNHFTGTAAIRAGGWFIVFGLMITLDMRFLYMDSSILYKLTTVLWAVCWECGALGDSNVPSFLNSRIISLCYYVPKPETVWSWLVEF